MTMQDHLEFFRPVKVKDGKLKKPGNRVIGAVEYWSDDIKNFKDVLIG